MAEKTECSNHKWIPLLGVDNGKNVSTSLFTCLKCGDLKVGKRTIKISRFRLDMGQLPINDVAGIRLIETPTADPPVSGFTISMAYGESLVPGDLLCFKSDGKVWKADADVHLPEKLYPVMGLALETAESGSHLVLLHGIYSNAGRYAFATVGGFVYLSTGAGIETQIQPSDTDNVIQVVGIATHADRIYFNPSKDYLTHI
ncbi:MAG: hypothetical protein NTW60_02780 [Candidatus Wolfebacteria bacterium]|nr:hypothetical protein [Candidatus Wolfebacteria bacterium]